MFGANPKLTANKGKSFWFMLEPLMMSKAIFDTLPPEHQKAIMDVGAVHAPPPWDTTRGMIAGSRDAVECFCNQSSQMRTMYLSKRKAILRSTVL